MRVGIDDQIFRRQSWGGITRMYAELATCWQEPGLRVDVVPLFRFAKSRNVAQAFPGVRVLDLPDNPWGSRAFARLNRAGQAQAATCDVIQHTFFDRRAMGETRRPRVCHVYDMIDELQSKVSPSWYDKRAFVDICDVVICISEATRAQLLDKWPVDAGKVRVIPLAASRRLAIPMPRPKLIPDSYLLYVGSRGGYKAFPLLIDALQCPRLLSRKELHVVAVGGGAFTADELSGFKKGGLSARILHCEASEADLAGLYQHATAVVQTSGAEGFGLPVLEAMIAGAPVVAADIDVVREVAKDAARLFSSGNSDSLAEALLEMITHPDTAEMYRRRGRLRSRDFSWAKTAIQTRVAYQEAIERFAA